MFDYLALDQHTCLKPSSLVCNNFTRPAGMLQYRCFKRCFEPTGMFVAVAPDHLAHPLQLNSTSMHVCQICIYQLICLNQLQLTYKHICSCVAKPAVIYVTLASDPQLVPDSQAGKHNCTRPSCMYFTVAPELQPCLYKLHTISMYVCYSFILSGSMYITFAPDHQPCLNKCIWLFPIYLTVASNQQSYL